MNNREFTLDMVKNVLKVLAEKDHFFCSEAHLQTEFTIEAAKLYPNNRYFPEIVPSNIPQSYLNKYGEKGVHFDLLIKTNNQNVLVEFKYITQSYANYVDDMWMQVKSHMAMDIRRYDCWKDIERIENFVLSNESNISYGYFILITNVPALYNNEGHESLDADFHIENGAHNKGIRKWKQGAGSGTIKGREKQIETLLDYNFKYEDFYLFDEFKASIFKSLVVDISP